MESKIKKTTVATEKSKFYSIFYLKKTVKITCEIDIIDLAILNILIFFICCSILYRFAENFDFYLFQKHSKFKLNYKILIFVNLWLFKNKRNYVS